MRDHLALARAALGLAQGGILYLLYRADTLDPKVWPATDGLVFAPLVLVSIFVPLLAVAGIGNLRVRSLALWIAAATAMLAGLAVYDILREPGGVVLGQRSLRNMPMPQLWLAVAAGLFIAQALVVSGDLDRRFVATYGRYFDIAWKQGVQIILAGVFVGVFWGVLYLGAELFKLIQINFLAELIKHEWFSIPVTTLAAACALHITDVRAAIVRGVRTLLLTLLSWILPLMLVIAVAFLAALLFTGLEPLWSTRRATTVVLLAAAATVLLINAAYQDGAGEQPVARVLRLAGTVAALVLAPFVVIAAYSVMLRVDQYGWTPERIVAMACVVVAACYAIGYAIAALRLRAWLKWIEVANIFTAFVIIGVMLALFSPIADPARIATADQVARLERGAIAPDKFDFEFLRFRSGRHGRDALERLKATTAGANAALIAEKATVALAAARPRDMRLQPDAATASVRVANITVIFPKNRPLPDGFAEQNWNDLPMPFRYPRCLTGREKCDAMLVDLDGDGKDEVVLLGANFETPTAYMERDSKWVMLGTVGAPNCQILKQALRAGNFEVVAPEMKELRAAGQRLAIQPSCPPL